MNNKNGKLIVIKQSKGCKMLCTEIRLSAGGPAGELLRFPMSLAVMEAYF